MGSYVPGDPFQCHVYLLEHGDQSVLFDPGVDFAKTPFQTITLLREIDRVEALGRC